MHIRLYWSSRYWQPNRADDYFSHTTIKYELYERIDDAHRWANIWTIDYANEWMYATKWKKIYIRCNDFYIISHFIRPSHNMWMSIGFLADRASDIEIKKEESSANTVKGKRARARDAEGEKWRECDKMTEREREWDILAWLLSFKWKIKRQKTGIYTYWIPYLMSHMTFSSVKQRADTNDIHQSLAVRPFAECFDSCWLSNAIFSIYRVFSLVILHFIFHLPNCELWTFC